MRDSESIIEKLFLSMERRNERIRDSGRYFLLIPGYYDHCEIRSLLMTTGE